MTDTVTRPEIALPARRIDPQRMAWGILLISFAVFCVICVVSGLGVHFFLFQSTVPLESQLEVGRGTVGITFPSNPVEQVARVEYDLSGAIGTTVRTDAQSQATISFLDSDRLIATVTLRSNTSFNLRGAARPRFQWSTVPSYVVLDNFSGEIGVFVADGLERDFLLSIQTPLNHRIYLDNSGTYIANASDSQVQVINIDGEAVLVTPDSSQGIPISAGSQGIVNADDTHMVSSLPYANLLANAVFPENSQTNGSTGGTTELRDVWICANGENDDPLGDYGSDVIDGRSALRLARGDATTFSHGETRCIKWFGQGGQSVEEMGYLELQASFLIASHSLNACGVEGSECPMMLRMDYIDVNNEPRRWIHGFSTRNESQYNYPSRCNSCTLDHELISPQYWYTYESGNLITLFPPNQRPRSIVNIQFYASGHQYDVYVRDVALLVGQNTQNAANEASQAPAGG